jgi:hypothetical protein
MAVASSSADIDGTLAATWSGQARDVLNITVYIDLAIGLGKLAKDGHPDHRGIPEPVAFGLMAQGGSLAVQNNWCRVFFVTAYLGKSLLCPQTKGYIVTKGRNNSGLRGVLPPLARGARGAAKMNAIFSVAKLTTGKMGGKYGCFILPLNSLPLVLYPFYDATTGNVIHRLSLFPDCLLAPKRNIQVNR